MMKKNKTYKQKGATVLKRDRTELDTPHECTAISF